MTSIKSSLSWVHAHLVLLVLAALPLIIAACTNGTGGSGY
jgi:hypothetical protein